MDKLRKKLGCTDDLPDGEAKNLQDTVDERTKNIRSKFEESALAVHAAMLHGIQTAAAPHGGLASASGETLPSSPKLKSWRHCMWSDTILVDWNLLIACFRPSNRAKAQR